MNAFLDGGLRRKGDDLNETAKIAHIAEHDFLRYVGVFVGAPAPRQHHIRIITLAAVSVDCRKHAGPAAARKQQDRESSRRSHPEPWRKGFVQQPAPGTGT